MLNFDGDVNANADGECEQGLKLSSCNINLVQLKRFELINNCWHWHECFKKFCYIEFHFYELISVNVIVHIQCILSWITSISQLTNYIICFLLWKSLLFEFKSLELFHRDIFLRSVRQEWKQIYFPESVNDKATVAQHGTARCIGALWKPHDLCVPRKKPWPKTQV